MVDRLTGVLGVADGERTPADLLFKQVLLVEEEDDGREREPLVVADGVKELHALMHPVLRKEKILTIAPFHRRDILTMV